MRPVFARGNFKTVELLLQLRKEACRDQEPRVAQRFHAIALSVEGHTVKGSVRNYWTFLFIHARFSRKGSEHINMLSAERRPLCPPTNAPVPKAATCCRFSRPMYRKG